MKRPRLVGLAFILGGAVMALAAFAVFSPRSNCPVDVSGVAMRCGSLTVPSRRDDAASGGHMALSYAILPARHGGASDPIVFLTGGPGSSAFAFLTTLADSPLRDTRDIIAVEQRGNGYSSPNLVCPEQGADPMRACYDRLVSRGADLATYDVTESAHDLADLKAALKIPRWNVVGVSMGTFWALHYARLHPDDVRSLILDSPVPAQAGLDDDGIAHLNGLSRVIAACAASTICNAQYPRLRERMLEATANLDAKPRTLAGENVDGARYLNMAIGLTFESATVPFVPMFLDAVARGDMRKAMKIAELDPYRIPRRFDLSKAYSIGLAVNMNCRDEAPFPAAAETRLKLDETWPGAVTERFVDAPEGDMRPACRTFWRVSPSDPIVNMPVTSAIPALILVGAFDPQTPPEWGRAMARTLPNATLAIVPDGAHAVLSWPSACVGRLTATFLDAPSQALATECLTRARPTVFKGPDEAIALGAPGA